MLIGKWLKVFFHEDFLDDEIIKMEVEIHTVQEIVNYV